MRATILHGAGDIRIEHVPDATLVDATDAVIRVVRTCICGSDLWPYRKMERSETGSRMGHEFIGLVEAVGADAKEVERGLKTESRIGSKAYVAPGGAFAGGTLARDVQFLNQFAARHGLALYAEHTADARARPGAHPNIDRLLAIAEQGAPALSCEFEPA